MTLTNYWILIIWVLAAGALLLFIFPRHQVEIGNGVIEERWHWLPALILVVPLILWAACRPDFIDTSSYRETITECMTYSSLGEYVATLTKDRWFYALLYLVSKITNGNDNLVFGFFAAFQILIIMLVFRTYSSDYFLSIFLFVASTDYLSWCWNGVRQFTAVVIILAATGFIVNKKYILAILMILLASMFHQSALLMLPVIFIIQGKPWNLLTFVCIIAAVIAVIFVNQFTNILKNALEDTQYTNVVADYQSWNDNGTSPFRVLVYSIPMILSIVGHAQIKAANSKILNMSVNASIMTFALYLVSMFTSGIFMGRLPIYVSLLATGILLPWEINHVFETRSSRYLKGILIICYCAYFYYQVFVSWGLS